VVLLQDVPAGVTFAGWDPGRPGPGSDVVGIHHPSGSWKRISFGTRNADATANVEGDTAPGSLYYQLLYSSGRVEHGSSGSPIFTSPGVVAGSLSYAEVTTDGDVCSINPQGAGYSRFSVTYSGVHDYLENLPAVQVTPAKSALSFAVTNHAAPAAQNVQLTTQSTGQVGYKLRADAMWIQLSNITGTPGSKTPATATISVDPKQLPTPGQYRSTVTILTGAAAPQYITVTTIVKVDQSNVVATITPNPVVHNGGQWSFQINLAETAGVATHVTAAKFNGNDYTSRVAAWFGQTAIAASGTIVAPLRGAGFFPAGDQYFEFWDIDDASGQPWYCTAVVTFK
jgi:hypothetical protein